MIKWPSLKFPPINLWSAPNQELQMLKIDRYIAANARENEIINRAFAEKVEQSIKEREFLYFCRSGRYPD